MNAQAASVIVLAVGGAILFAGIVVYLYFGRIWFRAYSAGVPVPAARLLDHARRGWNPFELVTAYVRAHEAGLPVSLEELEACHSTGGDVRRTVQLMIDSRRRSVEMSFGEAGEALAETEPTMKVATK